MLLLIYLHGFMGDETSFKSFPAHIHNILSITLAESHVVHSKIYPRYKSRKNISVARDNFSQWLQPHESPDTDVILVGHSLGGILAAEVVLCPSSKDPGRFQHRILGQIAFDTPFLGMHPGVVSTGIASLFRSPPEQISPGVSESPASPGDASSIHTTLSTLSDLSINPSDPNYNPAFPNDVKLAQRQGKWERGFYFYNKHVGELRKAAKEYVSSHLEHGGVLLDMPGLRRRYDEIRALEDIDDFGVQTRRPRVRFVNYYSASTGRIKERKEEPVPVADSLEPPPAAAEVDTQGSPNISPRISLSEHRDGEIIEKPLEKAPTAADVTAEQDDFAKYVEANSEEELQPMTTLDPNPEEDRRSSVGSNKVQDTNNSIAESEIVPEAGSSKNDDYDLPDLPALPTKPIPFDPSQCHDPGTLKLRQKEHDRAVKAYERALRDREKTIRERQRHADKQHRAEQKKAEKAAKEQMKRSNTLNPEAYDKQLREEAKSNEPPVTKQKDRKFCTLPSKDRKTGKMDPTWVRVYMEGMDEVVAHTSMFELGETYAKLVGDTAERIENWISHDMTRRAVMEAQDLD